VLTDALALGITPNTDRIGQEDAVLLVFMQNCGSERQWISSASRD